MHQLTLSYWNSILHTSCPRIIRQHFIYLMVHSSPDASLAYISPSNWTLTPAPGSTVPK